MAIHVFHGDKGGVGKSFAAAAFGEYLLGKGRQITIVESDARNADTGRYFDGAAVVKKIDSARMASQRLGHFAQLRGHWASMPRSVRRSAAGVSSRTPNVQAA